MFSFLKSSAADGTEKKGRPGLIVIAAAIGIVLILIGGAAEQKSNGVTVTQYRTDEDELVIYQEYLEKEIRRLCESVGGVGDVTVAVTLSRGFESVYATEWKDGSEKYVVIGSGANATALFLSRSAPKISGVGIICNGGSVERIRYELIALVSAAFDVSSNRIYVTQAK